MHVGIGTPNGKLTGGSWIMMPRQSSTDFQLFFLIDDNYGENSNLFE